MAFKERDILTYLCRSQPSQLVELLMDRPVGSLALRLSVEAISHVDSPC